MAALARNINNQPAGDGSKIAIPAISTEQVFGGSFVALVDAGNATAADRGKARGMTGVASEIPLGFATTEETGVADGSVEVKADAGPRIAKKITCTGVTGQLDVGKVVYLADDDPRTVTLTRPATAIPLGIITRFYSSTTVDVLFFGFLNLALLGMAGAAKYMWHLGTIGAGHAASANALTGIEAPHHGRFLSVYGIVGTKATDADVDQDINLEIGAVNVTGGVIEWLFSDAIGAKKAGTAITALGEFHEGDLIDVETVVNTAGTAADPGFMNIYAEVEVLPGL